MAFFLAVMLLFVECWIYDSCLQKGMGGGGGGGGVVVNYCIIVKAKTSNN